ncbi:S41 family peptidase [Pelagicoccus mobilis]|uniref:PDZ domain-containing protein n=1 Tax=Pelagicoccus mobilis TaxID=415221 RepID=A0A934RVT7_9BACT|nr:S41 family peptidase [Pelagicoccus mobilis]MBK1878650.1 PDZ domain-containing protein [Pelagicoccus mobilis]
MTRSRFLKILLCLSCYYSISFGGELSETQKRKLVEAVGKRLEQKAYAFETDFSLWEQYAAQREEEIRQANSKEELAKVLGEALDEFDLSHLGIFAPSTVKLRRAGKRSGMGITIHPLEQGGGLISYVLSDSPAERCGLQKGDVLETIDGDPLTDLKQLAGTIGQERAIAWRRGENRMSGKIVYASFSLSEPSSMKWITPDVALIRIQSFQYRFYKLARINRFFRESKNAKAIIIDLRNNRGGLSLYSRHLASKLSSSRDTFALLANKRYSQKKLHPLPFSNPYQGQVIVLTDSLSASAADIVPAFVSESGRGTVIGEKTSGALQLARSYPLPYGFRIYLPIAEMLTPNGNRLEAKGFPPEIELSLENTINDDQIIRIALDQIETVQASSEE